MGLGFVLVPFLIHRLGQDVFGLTVLAESTVMFFEILTISVRMAMSRHATFSLSQDRYDDFVEYLSTGRAVLHLSAAIVLALGIFVSVRFPSIFRVPAGYENDSRWLFFFVALGFTISIPNIVYWAVLYAKQRFDLINAASSVGLVLRAVALFLYYGLAPQAYRTLTAYGLIYLAMTFAQNSIIFWRCRRLLPELRFRLSNFRSSRVREILSFSAHSSIIRASALLYQETSHILINIFWGSAYNTVYAVSLKLPNMMRRIFVEPSWALTPTITDLAAKEQKEKIETLIYGYSKALSVATFPACLFLILYARPLIRAWVGPELLPAGDLMSLFSLSLFVGIPFSLAGCLTNAYGKIKLPSLVNVVSGVLNVVLVVLFGRVFDWKLTGVALASLVSSAFVSWVFLPFYACHVSGLSIKRYWLESLVKPFALAAVVVGAGFIGTRQAGIAEVFSPALLGAMVAMTGVYYGAAVFLIFGTQERRHASELLKEIRMILFKPRGE